MSGAAGTQAARVWIERLRLTDFRNYTAAALDLDPRPVVLTGHNGAGKTNLLEAVSLLTSGRGLRGRPFAELVRAGGSAWSVAADAHGREGPVALGTGFGSEDGGTARVVRIAGKTQSGSGALADHVPMVWLTPAMDGLFNGPASERRRFLDRLVFAFGPRFRTHAGRFEGAMRQRNRLFETGSGASALYRGLEEQMAGEAVAIAAARLDAVSALRDEIDRSRHKRSDSSFPFATIALAGTLEQALESAAAIDVEDAYRGRLEAGRDADRRAGRALEGPHLTDFKVGHGPKEEPAEACSSGEQKALLLGVVLAESQLIKRESRGLAPLVLLDEVAAHLDGARREALLAEIMTLEAQVWLTGTDAELFSGLADFAQFAEVNRGRIVLP